MYIFILFLYNINKYLNKSKYVYSFSIGCGAVPTWHEEFLSFRAAAISHRESKSSRVGMVQNPQWFHGAAGMAWVRPGPAAQPDPVPSLCHLFISISSPEIRIQINAGMTGPSGCFHMRFIVWSSIVDPHRGKRNTKKKYIYKQKLALTSHFYPR